MAGLTDRAVDDIKQMIVAGRLRPGDRLPREQDLAEQLGLSRATLREAVSALSVMKVIDVRHGDGMFVTSLAPEVLLEPLSFVVALHRDDSILHFMQLRSFVEPECAALAALKIGDEDLDRLREIVDEADRLVAATPVDHELMMANDLAFHSLVNAASANPVASAILAATSEVTVGPRVQRSMTEKGAEMFTSADHRAIYEAIVARDPRRAQLCAAAHIERTEDWFRRLGRAGSAGPTLPAD
jgi:GntR family transcriptional regulator, transcriptional repressor for pyruvate dehydrogenase complex